MLALSSAMYLSRFTNLFRQERSTHIRILSVPFLGVTVMGAVTDAMIPCSLALHLGSRQTGLREVCGCRMGGHHLRGQCELFPIHRLDASVNDGPELTAEGVVVAIAPRWFLVASSSACDDGFI